ncbi:MAG: hypothetical protein RJA98_2743 [Pseudomonadota bacterium]
MMNLLKRMALLLSAWVLVGCGGGSSNAGSCLYGSACTPATPAAIAIAAKLSLVDSNGTAIPSVAPSGTKVKMVVTLGGVPSAGAVVTVKSSSTKVVVTPADGVAVTDSTGVATVEIAPLSINDSGGFVVTATAKTTDGQTTELTAAWSIASGGSPVATSQLVNEAGVATTSVSNAGTKVKTTVTLGGVPQSGALVTVSSSSTKIVFVPSDGSALTDSSGIAYVQIAPSSVNASGAFELTVTSSSNGVTTSTTLTGSVTLGAVTMGTLSTGFAGAARLPAFGTSELSVPVLGAPAGTTVKVSFTSQCLNSAKASFSPSTATVGADGLAKTTYKDLGCATSANASDLITASVDGSTGVSTTASMPLTQPLATNIQFVSASPSTIYLASSGFNNRSVVRFQVVNQSGVGVSGVQLKLTPDTNAGGLQLNSALGEVAVTSDANGYGDVTVQAGTVPTPVRITARFTTSAGVALTAVSTALSINSGLPTQRTMSTALSRLNIEGMNYDGEATDVTVRLADRAGNPVPDGTAVNFVTESGQIVGSCLTAKVNGLSMCSGHLESQSPRPVNGLVSVLAYVIGEETFVDSNGNNTYDIASDTFEDLGDIFLDADESATWASGEQFVMYGGGGAQACPISSSAGAYSKANTCDGTWGKAHVRNTVLYVLSETASWPRLNDITGTSVRPLAGDPSAYGDVPLGCDAITTRTYLLRDSNTTRNNPWPVGSVVSAEGTGVSAKVFQTSVPNSLNPSAHAVEFSSRSCDQGVPKGEAQATIKVTSPRGVSYVFTVRITNP